MLMTKADKRLPLPRSLLREAMAISIIHTIKLTLFRQKNENPLQGSFNQ